MTEAEPRRILIGTFPAGYSHIAVPDGAVEAGGPGGEHGPRP